MSDADNPKGPGPLPPKRGPGEYIELTSEDEEILDRVWKEIAEERAQRRLDGEGAP